MASARAIPVASDGASSLARSAAISVAAAAARRVGPNAPSSSRMVPLPGPVPMAWGISWIEPSTDTDPSLARADPAMSCNKVVLPAPFGPMSAAWRPVATRKLTSWNSSLPPGWA